MALCYDSNLEMHAIKGKGIRFFQSKMKVTQPLLSRNARNARKCAFPLNVNQLARNYIVVNNVTVVIAVLIEVEVTRLAMQTPPCR